MASYFKESLMNGWLKMVMQSIHRKRTLTGYVCVCEHRIEKCEMIKKPHSVCVRVIVVLSLLLWML